MSGPVHTPRQNRSRETQERLLIALETLLAERFFEHITMQDIADEAGVAVGTIYRRFRDKKALLPILYERLDRVMADWAAQVWDPIRLPDADLRQILQALVRAHLRFYKENAPVLRTLYLQLRLDRGLANPGVPEKRRSLYEELLKPVWRQMNADGLPAPSDDQVRCFVLLLLAAITERCLFPDNTPSSALRMTDRRFSEELSEALYRYLAKGKD